MAAIFRLKRHRESSPLNTLVAQPTYKRPKPAPDEKNADTGTSSSNASEASAPIFNYVGRFSKEESRSIHLSKRIQGLMEHAKEGVETDSLPSPLAVLLPPMQTKALHPPRPHQVKEKLCVLVACR